MWLSLKCSSSVRWIISLHALKSNKLINPEVKNLSETILTNIVKVKVLHRFIFPLRHYRTRDGSKLTQLTLILVFIPLTPLPCQSIATAITHNATRLGLRVRCAMLVAANVASKQPAEVWKAHFTPPEAFQPQVTLTCVKSREAMNQLMRKILQGFANIYT